ncbi:hypothetical protein L2E82_50800 [Cichorium intybus]|nr:hypothetical protein L2E82_50800 [Cichorium intybus]
MLLLADVHAQDCNPDREINDCYPALIAKGSPSSLCCDELRRHNNCLSQIRRPSTLRLCSQSSSINSKLEVSRMLAG